jgi:Tol biopolymer transport system component
MAWSPDGAELAFTEWPSRKKSNGEQETLPFQLRRFRLRDGRSDLLLVGGQGWDESAHSLSLPEASQTFGVPAWSWDGKWLAVPRFGAYVSGGHPATDVVLVYAGRGRPSVRSVGTTQLSPSVRAVAWSGPNPTFVFPLWDKSGSNQIARVTIRSNSDVHLAVLRTKAEADRAWPDPTGLYIAYRSPAGSERPTLQTIRLLSVKEGEERLLFSAPRLWDVSWSPDGSRIAVLSDTGALEVVDLRTGRRRLIARRVTGLLAEGTAWTRDNEILFVQDMKLRAVSVDASRQRVVLDLAKLRLPSSLAVAVERRQTARLRGESRRPQSYLGRQQHRAPDR